MKKTYINRIKDLFTEYGRDDFSFLFGRGFTINHDCGKYDVLDVIDDGDNIIVSCVGYSGFSLKEFSIEDLSTNTIKKILKKIEESVEEE